MARRNQHNGAAGAVDSFQRLLVWIAMICGIGVGALIFVGPGGIAEEVPYHQAVGIGFAVFCLIFLVALSGSGGIASRAKNLLIGVLFVVLGGALTFGQFATIGSGQADVLTWVMAAVGVMLLLAGLVSFWAMLTGAPAPDEDGY